MHSMHRGVKSPFIYLVAFLLLVGEARAGEWEKSFEDYIAKFGKVYASQEEKDRRFKIYVERMEEARRMNTDENDTARYGETRFSDMTKEEFAAAFPAKMGVKMVMKEVEVPVKKLSDDVHGNWPVKILNFLIL